MHYCFVPAGFLCFLSYMARYNRRPRLDVSLLGSAVTDTRALHLQRGARLEPPAFRGHVNKTGGHAKAHALFFASSGKLTESHPTTPALATEYRIYNFVVGMHTEWICCSNANQGLLPMTCLNVSIAPCQAYRKGMCLPLASCLCRGRGFKSQAK